MQEKYLQNYVLERLALLERQGKVYAFRNNSFSGRIVRWNGTQGVVRNNKPGMPDVVACFPGGRFVGIELKSPAGRQSPEQKEAQSEIEALGGSYWLVRSPEEFEERLKG